MITKEYSTYVWRDTIALRSYDFCSVNENYQRRHLMSCALHNSQERPESGLRMSLGGMILTRPPAILVIVILAKFGTGERKRVFCSDFGVVERFVGDLSRPKVCVSENAADNVTYDVSSLLNWSGD